MAANSAVVQTEYGLVPVPYAGEWIGLARPGVEIVLEGMPQGPRKWTRRGQIFLTNLRMVFVADVPDGANGLQSYDLPFGYITSHSFHQPILGSNNLKGTYCVHDEPIMWIQMLSDRQAGMNTHGCCCEDGLTVCYHQ